MTAFAGSIGIIGIALILSLSNGFQLYINSVEEDTLAGYPLVISRTNSNVGFEDLMEVFTNSGSPTDAKAYPDTSVIYSDPLASSLLKKMTDSTSKNDMKSFKSWIDENESSFAPLTNAIRYGYHTEYCIYSLTETNAGKISAEQLYPLDLAALPSGFDSFESMMNNLSIWEELVDSQTYLNQQYDLIAGTWPQRKGDDGDVFDVVVSVDKYNRIYDYLLYCIGMMDVFQDIFLNENADPMAFDFDDFLGREYKVLLAAEKYQKNAETGKWEEQKNSTEYVKTAVENAITIRISGIIRPKEGVNAGSMTGVIGYPTELTKYMIEKTNDMQIVKEQLDSPESSVLTGKAFTKTDTLAETLASLGVADLATPSSVRFYVKGFEEKTKLIALIDEYNASVAESDPDKVIKYSDTVATLMSSVNDIVDVISYVLIAFVSISLVVSSIMIGIITYISVLERTKEIGVLRSIGASKRDISRLFNAETLTVGFMSGFFGILVTLLLNIPINLIIKSLTGLSGLAALPALGGIALVAISMFLSFIAGFIPSKIAAKKDPVVALRTE